jgi:secreted trypsin-like serine protease
VKKNTHKQALAGEFKAFAHPLFDGCINSCGGTLIYPDVIMSAAHCQGVWTDAGRVAIGSLSLCGTDATDIVEVEAEYIHPLFDFESFDNFANDIALIKLRRATTVIPTPWNANAAVPVDNGLVEACGFGQTESGDTDILLKVTMRAVNTAVCEALHDPNDAIEPDYGKEILCAGAEKKGGCFGDS